MNISERCYPDFHEGQVLSHLDLNRLRDFLYARQLFLARATFGFGVACGLDGHLGSNRLRLSPGFAINREGRVMVLEAGHEKAVEDLTASSTAGVEDFGFLEEVGDRTGYTAVLRPVEEVTTIPGECGDAECEEHASRVCRGAEVTWAAGRLSGVQEEHEVFAVEPLELDARLDPRPYRRKRNTLARHLEDLTDLEPSLLGKLRQLDLEPEVPPAARQVGVAFFNDLLHATREYARCVHRRPDDCLEPDGEEEIALGWLERTGDGWRWNCRYRHHFVLAPGLYHALHGEGCEDPCARQLRRIRSLLQGYASPELPAEPEDPPEEEDPVCDILEGKLRGCRWFPWEPPEVEIPSFPGEFLPADPSRYLPKWSAPPMSPLPVQPDWTDPAGSRLEPVWEANEIDPTRAGVLPLARYFGFRGEGVRSRIEAAVRSRGFEPRVKTVPQREFGQVDELAPGLVASVADEIVLGLDDNGAVVATGSIPTSRVLRKVGGQLPVVTERLDRVVRETEETDRRIQEASRTAETVRARMDDVDGKVAAVVGDVNRIREELPASEGVRRAAELAGRWAEERETLLSEMRRHVTEVKGEQEGRLERTREVLEGRVKGLEEDVKQRLSEVPGAEVSERARIVKERMDRLESELPDRLETTSRRLEERMDQVERELPAQVRQLEGELTSRLNRRLDAVGFTVGAVGGAEIATRTVEANDSMVQSLKELRNAMEKVGTEQELREISGELSAVEESVEVLEREKDVGVPLAIAQPERVRDSIENLARAVHKLGIDEESDESIRIRHALERLRGVTRPGIGLGIDIRGGP